MECDTSSLDEETSSLLNNGSSGDFEKQSELNDFDENEDTRSELKFDRGKRDNLVFRVLIVVC